VTTSKGLRLLDEAADELLVKARLLADLFDDELLLEPARAT
jgi:hypothetical protein